MVGHAAVRDVAVRAAQRGELPVEHREHAAAGRGFVFVFVFISVVFAGTGGTRSDRRFEHDVIQPEISVHQSPPRLCDGSVCS